MTKTKCITEPKGSIVRYVASETKNFEKIVGEDGVAEYDLGTNCYTWIGLSDGTRIRITTDYCGKLEIFPKESKEDENN